MFRVSGSNYDTTNGTKSAATVGIKTDFIVYVPSILRRPNKRRATKAKPARVALFKEQRSQASGLYVPNLVPQPHPFQKARQNRLVADSH